MFYPVWIDIFAPMSKKTLWLTAGQLAVPLGVVFGYISTAFIVSNWDWRWAFYIQGIAYLPISLLYLVYPQKYFSKPKLHHRRYSYNDMPRRSITYSIDREYLVQEGETGIPPPTIESRYKEYTILEGMKKLLSNKLYLFLTLSASCLYFVITGLQFWITDYLIIVLKLPESQAFIAYSVLCISAPTTGVLIGGIVIHNLGGYHAPGILGVV